MADKTPEQIISDYREAFENCYSKELADSHLISYRRGWYYITSAGFQFHYRKAQVIEMTDSLLRRVPCQTK